LLFLLNFYSYFSALIGSIFDTFNDGNNDAKVDIVIENIDIKQTELSVN
tara:strand:+ start:1134 stop:1280 length:147 start_codon:yes stop_codon:yes gene_type:complete